MDIFPHQLARSPAPGPGGSWLSWRCVTLLPVDAPREPMPRIASRRRRLCAMTVHDHSSPGLERVTMARQSAVWLVWLFGNAPG